MLRSTIQTTSVASNIHIMLEAVEKESQQFVIEHGRRKVAHLIPDKFLRAMVRFIDLDVLEQRDPGLADTIAILVNDDIRREIEKSIKEVRTKNTRTGKSVFNEILTPDHQAV